MARRRIRPGSGSHLELLRESGAGYGRVDVRALLGGVPYVIVGGLATRLYMPLRMTLDTDVLIQDCAQATAEKALLRQGCARIGPLAMGGSTWRLPQGQILDLIALAEPWVAATLRAAHVAEDGESYASLPYLILMKLAASRVQDLADISRMLGAAAARDLKAVRQVIQQYRPADAADLETLITLGRMEYPRR